MPALSNYLENKLVDALFRGVAYTLPSTFYFALLTSTPSDIGGGVEVTGLGYSRPALAANTTNFSGTQGAGSTAPSNGSSGTIYNNVDIQFPNPTANWGLVVALGIYDAPTGGNLLVWGSISPTKTINNGDAAPKFAAQAWSFQLDTD